MKNILRLFLVVILTQFVIAQTTDFVGIGYSGEVPPDPVIAVSNDYIVQAVNQKIAVFNKTGTKLFEQSFSEFFANQSPPSTIFDPKVAYDQYSNRFILLAGGKNTGSYYMLAVTENSNPMGNWHKYKLTTVDQGLSQYYIDFPSLGYDEQAIYLTSHQINGLGSYYPKITILKKSEVYSGSISYRKDFYDFSNAQKIKPMRKFGSSEGYYLVNTQSAGQIKIWEVENPLGGSNATLSAVSTITLGNYSSISAAEQKGTQNTVDIGDYSISDVVCKDGYLYGAYTAQNTTSDGSMIVYFKVNANNNYNLDINGKIETSGKYYYYPVLHPDNEGSIVFVFNKSSNNDYIGVAWTIRYAGNPNIEPIQWLQQGSNWYHHLLNGENRWGDYCGIALDPANNYRVWICGEWAYTNDQWSTWIGEISTGQTVDFTFTNTIYDEDSGILDANAGGTLNVNSTQVNSGNQLPLVTGNSYTEKTNNERFPNWNNLGYTYKHNQWNAVLSEKFLSNYLEANSSNTHQTAFFKSLNYAKIELKLEGQLITGKGAGQFQDPWYVLSDGSQPGNYWIDFNSFYEPTGKESATEKGVFLDQGWPNWDPPYYKVKAPSQTININGTNHQMYFLNWEASNATLQDANSAQTGVVFNTDNAVVKANYKGTQLTSTYGSYQENSQNKIVRIDGKLYKVYDSMNRIWLERSTNNGSSWELMNSGKPIDIIEGGRYPSIAYSEYDENEAFVIVYNLAVGSGELRLQLWSNDSKEFDVQVPTGFIGTFPSNSVPVVAFTCYGYNGYHNRNGKILVAWGYDNYVYYQFGILADAVITWNDTNPEIISSTHAENLTISKYGINVFHLAWQENWVNIKYCKLTASGSGGNIITVTDEATISTGGGYPVNYCPNIATLSNGCPIVVWVGSPYYNSSSTKIIRRIKGSDSWSSIFSQYGSNTPLYPQVNIGGTTYVTAWTENNGDVKFIKPWGGVITFGTSGRFIQLANSDNLNTMYGSILDNTATPRRFTTTTSIGSTYKTGTALFNEGRGVVAREDSIQFFFIMGDVSVNVGDIGFEEMPDTLIIKEKKELDDYLLTESFQFSDDDELMFSVYLGVTDSVAASSLIGKNRKVNFTIELIEDGSGKIVGKYGNFVHKKDGILNNEMKTYKINGVGIGNKLVRLRIALDTNIDGEFTLLDLKDNQKVLAKTNSDDIEAVSYAGELEIKDYTLARNYPNPFNPTTRIKYQLPKESEVKLRIFDILGREITTLIDQYQKEGRYEVEFNASKFASGVYIYRLEANDFVDSKKMLLVK